MYNLKSETNMKLTSNPKSEFIQFRITPSKKQKIQAILRLKNLTLTEIITLKIDEVISSYSQGA